MYCNKYICQRSFDDELTPNCQCGLTKDRFNSFLLYVQSPGGGRAFHNSAFENPNLLDNWDDAEGYYSKCRQPSTISSRYK